MNAPDWNARLATLRTEHLPDSRLGVWELEVLAPPGARPRLRGVTTAAGAVAALRLEADAGGAELAVDVLPDPALDGEVRAVASRSLAHLRRQPRHAAELVSQMILGEEALVLRAAGAWLQVQTGDRYVSWVHQGSIVRSAPADEATFRARLFERRPRSGSWVVVEPGLVTRAAPDPEAPPVADLVQGGIVEAAPAVAPARGALEIALPDGTRGWIPAGAAVPAERLAERFPYHGRAILDHAARFLGLPYLWGGTSEKGFDCSGLVQRIYGLHGVRLPRDSDQQFGEGSEVESGPGGAAIREGDLAFFAETPGGRATHVGILASGGRLLHASTTRGGVAWDALCPGAPGYTPFGERLAGWLTGIRRVLPA
ncbi:MAG TPA: C40 family peptidase [Gemmatimonadota bacterium]|nr:C40 family peptidase [Gemmatimonadota bacterium]